MLLREIFGRNKALMCCNPYKHSKQCVVQCVVNPLLLFRIIINYNYFVKIIWIYLIIIVSSHTLHRQNETKFNHIPSILSNLLCRCSFGWGDIFL